jgi:hypothetical protein
MHWRLTKKTACLACLARIRHKEQVKTALLSEQDHAAGGTTGHCWAAATGNQTPVGRRPLKPSSLRSFGVKESWRNLRVRAQIADNLRRNCFAHGNLSFLVPYFRLFQWRSRLARTLVRHCTTCASPSRRATCTWLSNTREGLRSSNCAIIHSISNRMRFIMLCLIHGHDLIAVSLYKKRYKRLKFAQNRPWRSKREEEVYLYSFFNLGAKWGWVVNSTPRPLSPRQRYPIPIVQEAG